MLDEELRLDGQEEVAPADGLISLREEKEEKEVGEVGMRPADGKE